MNPGKGEQPGAAKRNGVGTELKLNCFLNDHELLTRHQFVKLFAVAVSVQESLIRPWMRLWIIDQSTVAKSDAKNFRRFVILQTLDVAAIDSHAGISSFLRFKAFRTWLTAS